jgi:hypothetical protein
LCRTLTTLDMQLRAFAGSDGSGFGAFSISSGSLHFEVVFNTDSDRRHLREMVLSIGYDGAARVSAGRSPLIAIRPLAIDLHAENVGDVRAKTEGTSWEWQAGDPTFDDAVYVSTPTSEPEVLAQVLNPDVRNGVLQLLQLGFQRIAIDDDARIIARIPAEQLKASGELDRAQRVVAAFVRIAANVPPLQHSGQERRPPPLATWSTALFLIGGAGWCLNFGWVMVVEALLMALTSRDKAPDLPVLPLIGCILLGLVVGFYAGRAYGRTVGRLAMGRSDAHKLAYSASWRGFAGISVIVFTAGYVLLFLTSH